MPNSDVPGSKPDGTGPANSHQTISVEGIPSSSKAGGDETSLGPPQTVLAGGIPSRFKAGKPTIVKQLQFSTQCLPDGPDELKQEVANLAHAAITAVTHDSSVRQSRPEDWLERLRVHGYAFESMEQLLIASRVHMHSLVDDQLAVGTSERAERFNQIERRFDEIHARLFKVPTGRQSVGQMPDAAPLDLGRDIQATESLISSGTKEEGARKGDATMLRRADGSYYESVDFPTAQRYAGFTQRRRQQLMADGILVVVGGGQNRRISVASLMAFCPPV